MKTKTTAKTAKKAQTSKPTAKAKRKPVTQKRLASSARSPAHVRTETSDARMANDQHRTSKKATIEALVRRSEGAAITELIAATGWQQHSVRAALTGLRKAGHVIARERCDDSATRYRIAEVV